MLSLDCLMMLTLCCSSMSSSSGVIAASYYSLVGSIFAYLQAGHYRPVRGLLLECDLEDGVTLLHVFPSCSRAFTDSFSQAKSGMFTVTTSPPNPTRPCLTSSLPTSPSPSLYSSTPCLPPQFLITPGPLGLIIGSYYAEHVHTPDLCTHQSLCAEHLCPGDVCTVYFLTSSALPLNVIRQWCLPDLPGYDHWSPTSLPLSALPALLFF